MESTHHRRRAASAACLAVLLIAAAAVAGCRDGRDDVRPVPPVTGTYSTIVSVPPT